MGSLEKLSQRYGGKQFNLIGVSTDDYVDRAELFLKRTGTTFDNYIDQKLFLEHMLGAERLPLTLLVDAQGQGAGQVHRRQGMGRARGRGRHLEGVRRQAVKSAY